MPAVYQVWGRQVLHASAVAQNGTGRVLGFTGPSGAGKSTIAYGLGQRAGWAHVADDTLAFYMVSSAYDPLRERGVRWDDPAFEIAWPFPPRVISPRDSSHPDFDPGWHLAA